MINSDKCYWAAVLALPLYVVKRMVAYGQNVNVKNGKNSDIHRGESIENLKSET